MSDTPDSSSELSLVFGEFLTRRRRGESPTIDEYCQRYPNLAEQLRRHVRLYDALGEMFPSTGPEINPTLAEETILPNIAGYEVEAVLGHGGAGVVFRARDLRLGRPVAIKMLLAGAYAGPTELARFQLEAEAVAGLCHANVVQIYEVGENNGRPYFTMELVDGGNLAQKIAGTPQPIRWAAELIASLSEAVSVAHRSGIIHRDLKPGNILLGADGTPKISDFGLARRLKGEGALTWTGDALGTPSYMAPEQANATVGPVGPGTDVYGLGAVLYELLAGRPPFRAGTALETIQQVLSLDPIPPSRSNPKVPRDLETVCLKCLQKEPQRRYSSAAALAEDLRRFLLGRVVEARPVSPLERAGKWIRRNRWVAGLGTATLLALAVGTVTSLAFGIEATHQEGLANNRANTLQEQKTELERQKIDLEKKDREIEAKVRDRERAVVAGLLIPVGRNSLSMSMLADTLDPAEAEALSLLRGSAPHIRLLFLETALREPVSARRMARRADWVVQAIVGNDLALRAEVERLLAERIQEPDAPREVKLTCARLGTALYLDDRVWAERSAAALSDVLCDPQLDRLDAVSLANALARVCDLLPRNQAAEYANRVTGALLMRLQEPAAVLGFDYFAQAIAPMSPYLETTAANRNAETLWVVFRKNENRSFTWKEIVKAQVAVCKRLSPTDAAAHRQRTFDFVIAGCNPKTDQEKYRIEYHIMALKILCEQSDAATASRVADIIVAILGDGYTVGGTHVDFVTQDSILDAFVRVAERLDAAGALRAAKALVRVLQKADIKYSQYIEKLRTALGTVCLRLDADGAAAVAEAIAGAIREPNTALRSRVVLAHGFGTVADKLDPAMSAPLEIAMVEALTANLADPKSVDDRDHVGQALASVCGRADTTNAARAAEAISTAIHDPKTRIVLQPSLVESLVRVSRQLGPEEDHAHATRAVDLLNSLWTVPTKHFERAMIAEALATAWTRLGPEASVQAERVAAQLEAAFRDPRADSFDLFRLAAGLVAVSRYLTPAERLARANTAADILIGRIGNPKSEAVPSLIFTQGLATLCAILDRDGVTRVADAYLTILDHPEVQRSATLTVHTEEFKKIAVRMDERDLERFLEHPLGARMLQRIILDVLGESKGRHFRNTWEYLEWSKSQRK
jgi:Protein kinase domain